ncbi:MAG: hypothetical protein WBO35_04605 [Candidatus Saccharimonadales bacterium]|jgi:hypothetical protein
MKQRDPFTGMMIDVLEVTQPEFNRQMEVWDRKTKEIGIKLLRSGIARKVFTSRGSANVFHHQYVPNEGTEVHVSRVALGDLSSIMYEGVYRDTGIDSQQFEATVYCLNRKDTISDRSEMQVYSLMTYFAGAGFPGIDGLKSERASPVKGVLKEDLLVIDSMARHLERFREEQGLNLVHPYTLALVPYIVK